MESSNFLFLFRNPELPDKNALGLCADSSSKQKYMKGKHELLTEYDFWSH